VPSNRPDLALLSRTLRQPRKGMAHDYRLMVEAVQAGDLTGARKAYGRMMEQLSRVGAGADDTLAKIGASLRSGDLAAAHRALARVESRALSLLRDLRAHVDFTGAVETLDPTGLRKPN